MSYIKSNVEIKVPNQQEAANMYLSSIYNQVMRLGFSHLSMTTGRPQTGKSLFDGTINCLLDPTFFDNLETRVVYDANGFMKALNGIIKRHELGRAVMWDEAGVGMPARQWYDISNKAISYTVQVAGVFRPFVGLVTQDMSYIDSQPRKLINTLFEVSRSNNKYATAKVFNITIDRKRGKAYYKSPTMITKDGIHVKLKGIRLTKPPKEFIKRYLDHSKPYKERITQMMEQRTEQFDAGVVNTEELSAAEIIQVLLRDDRGTYELGTSQEGNRKFSKVMIQHDFKLPDKLADFIKARAEQISRKTDARPGREENSTPEEI
jgi:hypothetical protein